jgi:hypothetical protein
MLFPQKNSAQIQCEQRGSTLTLLVTRIFTNHAHNAFALDDFAFAANFLYRSLYFHVSLLMRLGA